MTIAEGRTSVLAKLTADVMAEKKVAARTLTPVEGEVRPSIKPAPEKAAAPIPDVALLKGDIFPYDGGISEQAVFSIRNIRDNLSKITQYGAMIEECLQSIEREVGLHVGGIPKREPGAPTAEELAQKEKEKFADDLAAKAKAAQAQVFTEPSGEAVALAEDMGEDESEEADGWTCPDHGKAIDKVSAKSGRTFRACPDCKLFER